jgi:hypothetical protein
MNIGRTIGILATLAAAGSLAACGSSSKSSSSACVGTPYGTTPTSGGGLLQPFTPPCDPGPGRILLTASGEVLALGGYAFPQTDPNASVFVDGWEFAFSKVLVTFDHVRLNQNPDLSPTDESQVGALVTQVDGPWAVDLHRGGPVVGKGGPDEQAVPIAAIYGSFDPAQRYAFSFDTVAATTQARNVNLDLSSTTTSDYTDYQEMIAQGYSTFYIGTATWKGDAPGVTCTTSDAGYDFTHIPRVVHFRIGFAAPTSYINCQNPDNDPAAPFPGEESQRGIFVKANATTIAQATFHTDHPLWESFVHDSPIHFDQVAAQYASLTAATDPAPTATLEGMVGVDFSNFTDALGANLPWRSCVDPTIYTLPAGTMHFDNLAVPYVFGSTDPAAALRDYRDYMTYNLSTFGHLNSDGLGYVRRNYPSPH